MAALNQEQRDAFLDVLSFINDPNRKYHRISGGAGTGKSFFISKVADDILKHKAKGVEIYNVAITATTNKAAAVLQDSMPHHRSDIQTIYSFMNLRVSNNYNDGTTSVVPTARWTVHDNTLIIVDEASMVNRTLMDFIDKGTTKRCKVLFVGDKNQLAPVKEHLSPVYAKPYTESLLIHPVRNSNQPALMDLCEKAKDTVLTGKFHPIQEVPGVIDFVNGNELKGVLEREYNQEDAAKRVLCYTNRRVVEYNNFIKTLRGYSDHYNVGEMMTNNSAAELVDKTRLYTDQIVEIKSVGPIIQDTQMVPGHTIELRELEVQDPSTGTMYKVTVFADPPDREEVLKYYGSRKKWDRYFKIKENYPDLRSVAASTTHKAQGSTYDSVIVDLGDIGKSTQLEQTARLLYVALSRPRNHLYIRGQLPERYFK